MNKNDFNNVQVYKIIPDYKSFETIEQLKQTIKKLKNRNRRLKRNLVKHKKIIANIKDLGQIFYFLDVLLSE